MNVSHAYLISFVFICFTHSIEAQYPDSLKLEELRTWLKSETYDPHHTNLGYSEARRQMYSYTDEVDGLLYCIYTDFSQPAEYTTFPDPINAEHLVPQSLFGYQEPMRADIHVLRPCHQSANSSRENWPFGEVPDADARWYGLDSLGNYVATFDEPASNENWSESLIGLWEPQEDSKGDVARQIFYFYTMYPSEAGTIDSVADPILLYTWHLNDPVDALEIQRNDRVEVSQGNRNPYVDHPDLVYDAWFYAEDPCEVFDTSPVDLTKSFQPVPYPDGVIDRVQVKWYKESPHVKYAPEDSAACDIQFWSIRDLVTNTPISDPDTSLIADRTKPGQDFFKWPIKFQRPDVHPNIRYRWRVRCACQEGAGQESPWSEGKIFNTPDYDPVTNIYTPPGIWENDEIDKKIGSREEGLISIFPNPSSGAVYLQGLPGREYRLFDLSGRVVQSIRFGEKYGETVVLHDLEKGMYLVQDSFGGVVHRLIIQ
ncbi:MAG: T9SS type A sorting domain-containing protein [Flavobacteriales bacterium]|nr:T9SS type A sorting domain-containing protein [Flavobacteriales bacterium]